VRNYYKSTIKTQKTQAFDSMTQEHNLLLPAFTKSKPQSTVKLEAQKNQALTGALAVRTTKTEHDLASDHEGQNQAVGPKTQNEVCAREKSCQGSVLRHGENRALGASRAPKTASRDQEELLPGQRQNLQ
jgi:hypothetical protein